MPPREQRPKPIDRLTGVSAYRSSPPATPTDLRLDGNEGEAPQVELLDVLIDLGPDCMRCYPDATPLQRRLAERLDIDGEQILVTAGGDEVIDRICRAYLEPGRNLIHTTPTFEMIDRYARLAGGELRTVPWPGGEFPAAAVLQQVSPETAVITVVSPNNPTGATVTAEDLQKLSTAAPHALLLVDLAYGEFADADLTSPALRLPNAVVLRSFSKAWGMAGLRVGFAAGPPDVIATLRAAGGPYSVSRPSLALAAARLDKHADCVDEFIQRVRQERQQLTGLIDRLGAEPYPSQANFVLARFGNARWVWEALAGLGIAVRRFGDRPELDGCLRISCPGEPDAFARLTHALQSALAPEGILFDMDGVLVDVSRSYRQAIHQTAAAFGVNLTPEAVLAAKERGNANNDWELTRRLIAQAGVPVDLQEVTDTFERLYQGSEAAPGLRLSETLLGTADLYRRLASRMPLGIVTGRPRKDADRFLEQAGIADCFSAMSCLGETRSKPDPEPVHRVLDQLGIRRAWLVGDTVDDIHAARAAQVVPLGVIAPQDPPERVGPRLIAAGAARILASIHELEELCS